jgi:succinyl-CoA synthetase alpha subunit
MGHAGAIISGGKGTADEKMKAMRKAGITVVDSPAVIGETMEKVLKKYNRAVSKGKKVKEKNVKKKNVKNIPKR